MNERLVVLSVSPFRVTLNARWWRLPWEVFQPSRRDGPRMGHLELAIHAVREGWGPDVKVIQDDVQPLEWPPHVGRITAYGGRRSSSHVCPKAFTATPEGWQALAEAWSRAGKTCELWKPEHVYDVVVDRGT